MMMNIYKKLVYITAALAVVLTSCEKLPLQRSTEYKTSQFDNTLDMSVWDFMQSRPDLFTSLNEAIVYVDEDPAYSDVKQLFFTTGNTFLLPTDNALSNIDNGNSYFSVNKIVDNQAGSPTIGMLIKASSWRAYSRDQVANFIRYHVVKGYKDFKGVTTVPTWYETFAYNADTNPTGVVNLYINGTRDGNFYMNNYVGAPVTGNSTDPQTPNLIATNGVVHVLERYLTPPTLADIENN